MVVKRTFSLEPVLDHVTLPDVNDGDYRKITNDPDTFPGPKAFLVSGYGERELTDLRLFLEMRGYTGVPVKPCTPEQIGETVLSVLLSETLGTPAGEGKLPNVFLFSGMTSKDVQIVMGRFADNGLKRPIFATTTPTNLNFTVKTLLLHLLEEEKASRAASAKRQR